MKALAQAGARLLHKLRPRQALRQTPKPSATLSPALVEQWPLSPAATLGSSVRTKGIEREVRARLPWSVRKHVKAEAGQIALRMQDDEAQEFTIASYTIAKTLESIEDLPVLPREVEDVLTISSRERHKWFKDGRLRSAGTRTVKMRGRSKAVTFHVFDPRHIEDVLDRDLPSAWREADAQEVAENRRRGAGKAALTRARKGERKPMAARKARRKGEAPPDLDGFDAFEETGLLR